MRSCNRSARSCWAVLAAAEGDAARAAAPAAAGAEPVCPGSRPDLCRDMGRNCLGGAFLLDGCPCAEGYGPQALGWVMVDSTVEVLAVNYTCCPGRLGQGSWRLRGAR